MIIRYSQIEQFVRCPMGYKQRYIDGVQDTERSSALELGTALHLALKVMFEDGDYLGVFNMYWDSLKDVEMVYYRHDWEALRALANDKWLPNFARLHKKKFKNVIMEHTLTMPILKDHTIQGTFDMLSEYDGVWTLSDWKTSSKEYRKDKIENNPQMYIYSALAEHNKFVVPQQIQYKVFRKDNASIQTLTKQLTSEALHESIRNVETIVKHMLWSIETGNWYHSFECYCKRLEGGK